MRENIRSLEIKIRHSNVSSDSFQIQDVKDKEKKNEISKNIFWQKN